MTARKPLNAAVSRLKKCVSRIRSFGAACVLAGIHVTSLSAVANIDCTSNPAIFNTAANATQTGVLNVGSNDIYWERSATPGSATPTSWVPAVVSNRDPGWVPNASNAGWVSERSCGGSWGCLPAATYYYRFAFNLDAVVDPATLALTFTMIVDDRIDDILVNGVSQGISGGNWNSTLTRTLSSGWVNGPNQIWIRMTNTGGPGGIQVRSTGSSMCRPKLEIVKQTQGGFGGPFTFTGNNGWASRSVSTTAAGAPGVSTGSQILSAAGVTTVVTETLPTNYVATSASCTGLSNGASATLSQGTTLTLPATGLDTTKAKAGLNARCSVVNSLSTLRVQKFLSGSGRLSSTDQFTVAIRTGGVNGTVVNSTATSTTSGAGSVVTNGNASIVTNARVVSGNAPKTGTIYTITESMALASLSALSAYAGTITCTDSNGLQPSLPNGVALDPATGYSIYPVEGSQISCTITNTPVPSGISGRVFLDNGAGAGIPNNGVLAGTETGIKGVAVSLTNCGSTVYGSTVADGDGRYSFAAPAAAPGSTVCVNLGLTPDKVSTGASVGSTAMSSGSTVTVGGVGYTYSRSAPRISFAWSSNVFADLNFGLVPANVFEPDGAKTALAGTSVTYPHMFQATTSGTVVFSVLSSSASPALVGWSQKIFADPTCTGQLQPGATQLFPPLAAAQSVLAGQVVCIVVQELVPANALAQYRNEVTVQAAFTYANASPALSATYRVRDVTTVSAAALALLKEVRNVTQGVSSFGLNNQGRSGDVLEYRITYTNMGAAPVSVLVVNDATPAFSTFVSASAGVVPYTLSNCLKNTPANALPAAAVSCATVQAAGGTGSVRWRFTGELMPGASGSVLYQVRID